MRSSGLVVLVLFLGIYVHATITWLECAYQRCHWQSTTGTVQEVTNYDRGMSGQRRCSTYDVAYDTHEREVATFTSQCFSTPRYTVGDSVELLYKKQHPTLSVQLESRWQERQTVSGWTLVLCTLSVVLFDVWNLPAFFIHERANQDYLLFNADESPYNQAGVSVIKVAASTATGVE